MKITIVSLLMLVSAIVLAAQDTASIRPPLLPPNSPQEISREEVQPEDLPEAVKESLKGQDYAGWNIDRAYKALMTDPTSPESEGIGIYIVDLKKGTETKTVRFDKDGNELDDEDNDH
jgi:hypothetical protein